MKEMTKEMFFQRLKESLESYTVDINIVLVSLRSFGDPPIVEKGSKSSDYNFTHEGGMVRFYFSTDGLDAMLNVDVYGNKFISLETQDGDTFTCGEYGEDFVAVYEKEKQLMEVMKND